MEYGTDVEELHAALRRVIIQDLLGCPGVPVDLCDDDAPWIWDCNGNGIPDCVERHGYNPANLAACIEAMILAETPYQRGACLCGPPAEHPAWTVEDRRPGHRRDTLVPRGPLAGPRGAFVQARTTGRMEDMPSRTRANDERPTDRIGEKKA